MASAVSPSDCCCTNDPCKCHQTVTNCMAELCPPRPCFFNGQLITADDLNAMMNYFSKKNALLAKLALGWGVLGGMRLLQSDPGSFGLFGAPAEGEEEEAPPCLATLCPNPQIVNGPRIRVSAGAALDAAGQTLTACEAVTLDLQQMEAAIGMKQAESRSCGGWFGSFCAELGDEQISAREYWVVARRKDVPSSLSPVVADLGGKPPETCNYSRIDEEVEFVLLKELPLLYFLHGCCLPTDIPCVSDLLQMLVGVAETFPDLERVLGGPVTADILTQLASIRGPNAASKALVNAFGGLGFKLVPQLMEFVNSIPVNVCCSSPGVVLGRVLLANPDTVPESVARVLEKVQVGPTPFFVFIDDAFPYRRLIGNSASNQLLWTSLASLLVTADETVLPHPGQGF